MTDIRSLSAAELHQWQQQGRRFTLLDVREDDEVAYAALAGHVHIPMNRIPLRHNELDDDAPIVVYCHHGIRSMQVALFLANTGFEQLYNLSGGIDAWSQTVDATVPRY